MKKMVSLLLVCLVMITLTFSATAETFTATAPGFGGDVTVTLAIEGDKLLAVEAEGNGETAGVGSMAIEQLPGKMLEANSVAVDGIAGATISSTAFLTAASEALAQSGVELSAVSMEKTAKAEDTKTQVVVVGAGIAGISAAISAKDAGLNVILVEKNATTGGAAMTSEAAALWAVGVDATAEKYDFTVDEIYEFFNTQSGPVYNKDLFYKLANDSHATYDFLVENGVTFSTVFQCNPTADGRFWGMFADNGGAGLMSTLAEAMNKRKIDVRLNSKVTELVIDESGKITGVKVESENGPYTITADNVILATGGYGQNEEMMAKYVPGYDRIVINMCYSGATGDGITMAESVGGHTVGDGSMGGGWVTAMQGNYETVTDGQPITMNISGEQVAPANVHYTKVYTLCLEQPDGKLYTLFPADIDKYTELTQERLDLMIESGGGWKADTLEELADLVGMDKEGLLATVEKHNAQCAAGTSDDFGTPLADMIPVENGPYYMLRRVPGSIGTIAGVEVDTGMHVLDAKNEPITNLYAVGELIYGNWFDHCYPMSGTALGGCVSSARLAVEDILK